jgi:uroporphyrinogen decarboxylase
VTRRERVLTALRRERPDRVPAVLYDEIIGYVPRIAGMFEQKCGGRTPRDYFGFDITSASIAPPREKTDFTSFLRADEETTVDEWGVGWKSGSELHYRRILHPLENADGQRLRSFPFPDLDAPYRYDGLADRVRALQDQGLAVACFPGSIFETAWYMRGMEQLFLDMAMERADADFLLDSITRIVAGSARHLAAAGIDLLILGDDIAGQTGLLMSLPMWREFLMPRLVRVIRAAKEVKPDILIFYHSDGKVWDAIPGLIEAGVEVLNPVQPECMDPARVKREFGDRLSFFGSISVQKTMPFGTPDNVHAEVKLRMETIGKGGGLLLAPAHVLQPDTPWENVVAFFHAVEEFGYYK